MSVALQVERCEMDYSIVTVFYLCITECQEQVNPYPTNVENRVSS